MSDRVFDFGLLLVVFGGFLMLGRDLFAADSNVFGQIGLLIMILGVIVGLLGLAGDLPS